MSGYYHPVPGTNSGDLYGGSKSDRDRNDLDWRLMHLPPPNIAVRVATSKEERYDDGYAAAHPFLREAKAPMSAQDLVLHRRGHHSPTSGPRCPAIPSRLHRPLPPPPHP